MVKQTEMSDRPLRPGVERSKPDWSGAQGAVGEYILAESEKTLAAYSSQPNLVLEHANHEEDTARGGYATRQLFELIQNGADALSGTAGGRIWLRLTPTHLYCADEGQPIDQDGVRALMFSHLSPKRGTTEIGRFGLGFKSVLGVSDRPEFFSRSGSFRFDRKRSSEIIWSVAPDVEKYPVLRLPEVIDPWPEADRDTILGEMMGWASNVVRLPLFPGAIGTIEQQIRDFPPEFLLFVEHVTQLILQGARSEEPRILSLSRAGDEFLLDEGTRTTRWKVIKGIHVLTPDARSDRRSLDDNNEVPIAWAAPTERLNEPGKFWAFFPTLTTSLLSGILNAPWKTNEDRQNLLRGVYNDELIDAAAKMVVDALPALSTSEDPARHLDTLPRRLEQGDSDHSSLLRDRLNSELRDREFVPDQEGTLRKLNDVSYPPRELTRDGQIAWESLDRWAAHEGRPSGWVHHGTLNRNRLATLDRVFGGQLPRARISGWLEALLKSPGSIEDCVRNSMAAIQAASLMPEPLLGNFSQLGRVVLTADGSWVTPDPDAVFLGGDDALSPAKLVHPELQEDAETLFALEKLGIKPASAESAFRESAGSLLGGDLYESRSSSDAEWRKFWELARNVEPSAVERIIRSYKYEYRQGRMWKNWRDSLCVLTLEGKWDSLFATLLPGFIVPADGSRDADVTIDMGYHQADVELLARLDAAASPRGAHELSYEQGRRFTSSCQTNYQDSSARNVGRRPQESYLVFESETTSGPLDVMAQLSEDGKALYTEALLNIPESYVPWTMKHVTQDIYLPKAFKSPTWGTLRLHGRIRTESGIRPLSDGLGDPPKDPSVTRTLLSYPMAEAIRRFFDIHVAEEDPVEPVGTDDPIPLLDMWPGLKPHLSSEHEDLLLVRCDGFRNTGRVLEEGEMECLIKGGSIYIARMDSEIDELMVVLEELGLQLSDEQVEAILGRTAPPDVRALREEVRKCSTEEERLLVAVGEIYLVSRLPASLIAIMEQAQGPLSGIQTAQAAISTYHTGALREYRHALAHLNPPKQWTGGPQTVAFVRSLGFGEEWAGDRTTRRNPFLEVEGPRVLPPLHDYQRRVVRNVRQLIGAKSKGGDRRGMVSMPTGSGKTRVAVQAVVEAIRDGVFQGGVLWVADRDELCEQAVEAWREVWSSEGAQDKRLRITRMWGGQPPPLPTSEMHVIVATIQTLASRIERRPEIYDFLADFRLLVFDEAHRSIAPTFTSAMQELGLTRWQRFDEPFLIGLTATPYRGYDEAETQRLVNRYGANRLDSGAFSSDDPEYVISELQEMRVLARADHATIEGGQFSLSHDELQQTRGVPWLPRSVEDRIAGDTERTKRIIGTYLERVDPTWPTLIFATSVEHAQTIAALLTSMGVKARAVSGSTEPSVRRRVVGEFRSGEIKALVNYGVFREGFDAPKTRAIIVARPVYSPNLYFQMIGRGLRGVKNGGNDRCLILNVRDNIDNFEGRLAFSDLDWLWD